MVQATNLVEDGQISVKKGQVRVKKSKTHPSLKEQEKEIRVISYFGDKGAKLKKTRDGKKSSHFMKRLPAISNR